MKAFKYKLIFTILCCLHAKVDYAFEMHNSVVPNENKWIEQTTEMYNIIERYKNRTISLADQQEFKQLLDEMKKYVDNLDLATSKHYTKVYLNPYQGWAQYILTADVTHTKSKSLDPSVTKRKPTHVKESDHDMNIDNTILGLSEKQKRDSLQKEKNEAKARAVLSDVEQQILRALNMFSDVVKKILKQLDEHATKQSVKDFYENLRGSVETFKTRMVTIEHNSNHEYEKYLKDQGKYVHSERLTPEQNQLISNVRKMSSKALLQVHAVALDLTAQTGAADFANQTADALQEYDEQAEKEYQKSLQNNEQEGIRSTKASALFWDKLKSAGSSVVDKFVNKAKEVLTNEGSKILKEGMQRVKLDSFLKKKTY